MSSVDVKHFVTTIKTIKKSCEWKIENFLLNNKKTGEEFCSPSFTIDENNIIKWHIKVYPKGNEEDVKEYLSIINKDKKKMNIANLCYHYKSSEAGYGYPTFIPIVLLKNKKEILLPDGNLTICCDMNVGYGAETYETDCNTIHQSKRFKFDEDHEEQIQTCKDLGSLLNKGELTDIVLKTCNEELRAHKAVLAARSPVFLAMFTNNMIEKLDSKIKIIDFDSEIVSEMLEFMYTGKVKNIEKNGVDLLRIADKYQVLTLKNLCENFLYNSMSIKNATDLLILAEQISSNAFKTKVMRFILSHKKKIISTPQFIDLKEKYPALVADLFCTDC